MANREKTLYDLLDDKISHMFAHFTPFLPLLDKGEYQKMEHEIHLTIKDCRVALKHLELQIDDLKAKTQSQESTVLRSQQNLMNLTYETSKQQGRFMEQESYLNDQVKLMQEQWSAQNKITDCLVDNRKNYDDLLNSYHAAMKLSSEKDKDIQQLQKELQKRTAELFDSSDNNQQLIKELSDLKVQMTQVKLEHQTSLENSKVEATGKPKPEVKSGCCKQKEILQEKDNEIAHLAAEVRNLNRQIVQLYQKSIPQSHMATAIIERNSKLEEDVLRLQARSNTQAAIIQNIVDDVMQLVEKDDQFLVRSVV